VTRLCLTANLSDSDKCFLHIKNSSFLANKLVKLKAPNLHNLVYFIHTKVDWGQQFQFFKMWQNILKTLFLNNLQSLFCQRNIY